MKSLITTITLATLISIGSFAPHGTFLVSSAEAYGNGVEWKKKMDCLSKGHHWKNGYCYKRKKKTSSSAASSKQIMGNSDEYFYSKRSAIDIAQTEVMNKTSKHCGSSYKSRIDWHDRQTTCRKLNSQYKCKVYATANCLSESCGKSFCGTRR